MEEGSRGEVSGGLKDQTPLGGRIGVVKVAVRPPDPLLMERIADGLDEVISRGVKIPGGSSMAVRSIDGFYYIRKLQGSVRGSEPGVVSVVNYDPVRRTFILSGSGEVDDAGELFWFAFEAFVEDSVLFLDPGENGPFCLPDGLKGRVSKNLNILKDWNKKNPRREDTCLMWRGRDLDSFFSFLEKEYPMEPQS